MIRLYLNFSRVHDNEIELFSSFFEGRAFSLYESEQEEKRLLKNFCEQLDKLREKGVSVESILSGKNAAREVADYGKQIQRLKDNFCSVTDEEYCGNILRNVTYYRLKGYFLALLEENNGDKTRVKFEDGVRVYDFDAKLRAILLYALWRIEIYLAAQFVQFHTETYQSPFSYLNRNAYDSRHNHRAFLNGVQRAVRNNKDAPTVEHYLKNHSGIMPFWAVSQLFTFGNWTHFYADMKQDDKAELLKWLYDIDDNNIRNANEAKRVGIKPEEKIERWRTATRRTAKDKMLFTSWLDCCGHLRNVCAHNGRLYARGFVYTPIMPREFGAFKDEKKLWAAVLSVRFLYPDEADWNAVVLPQLSSLFDSYRAQWGDTEYGKLLSAFGFPSDWADWLQTW